MPAEFSTIDDYIASFPPEVQAILQQIRALIQTTAPDASEAIKYAIPTFVQQGNNLVHFAAFKHHIGFYALPTTNEVFRERLLPYKMGKGSIQFPLNQAMPFDLIADMVKYRLRENAAKLEKKTKK